MRIDPFEYIQPRSIQEALAALAERGPEAKILAGGSDLLVRMKQGILSPKFVIDITHVGELKYLWEQDGFLKIGAGTRLSSIEDSGLIKERYPALAAAASRVASFQIRNAATIGGNICLEPMCWYYNQSRQWRKSRPACNKAGGEVCHVANKPNVCYATYRGDTATALIALGAKARILSLAGGRTIPLEDLFTGEGKEPLILATTEMITEVQVPIPGASFGCAYLKISHRNAVDYPQVGVGASLTLAPGSGACVDVRLVLGAVASAPVRVRQAEEMFRGHAVTPELIEALAEVATRHAHPVNNMTFGAPGYRRKMVKVVSQKALFAAFEKAKQGYAFGGGK